MAASDEPSHRRAQPPSSVRIRDRPGRVDRVRKLRLPPARDPADRGSIWAWVGMPRRCPGVSPDCLTLHQPAHRRCADRLMVSNSAGLSPVLSQHVLVERCWPAGLIAHHLAEFASARTTNVARPDRRAARRLPCLDGSGWRRTPAPACCGGAGSRRVCREAGRRWRLLPVSKRRRDNDMSAWRSPPVLIRCLGLWGVRRRAEFSNRSGFSRLPASPLFRRWLRQGCCRRIAAKLEAKKMRRRSALDDGGASVRPNC